MGGLEYLLELLKRRQQAPWNGGINGQLPPQQYMSQPYTGIMSGQLNRQPSMPVKRGSPYYGGGIRG